MRILEAFVNRVLDVFSEVFRRFFQVGGKTYRLKNFVYHRPGDPVALATIRARKSADGSLRYTAQLRIRNNGAQVYQDSQIFSRKQAAQVWSSGSRFSGWSAI